jgi:hypothetical protein
LLADEAVQLLVERFEKYVEGQCSHAEVATLRTTEEQRRWVVRPYSRQAMLAACLELTRFAVTSSNAFSVADEVSSRIVGALGTEYEEASGYRDSPERSALSDSARAAQISFLRDIFGNPYRPVTFSPEWRTDTAVALARTMYETRDFSAMPILADALQDAGCCNEDILNHCRGLGPHVRGCWVVDLVLGKE